MDASNVINFGLLVIAAIAAVVSVIAVVDARRARDSAAANAWEAQSQAERAAAAAEGIQAESARIAEQFGEFNARQAARDAAQLPWIVERVSPERWKVFNATGSTAHAVSFLARPPATIQMEDGLRNRDVPHGQPVFIMFGGGITDPSTATVIVSWWTAGHRLLETVITLA